jgi:hypothetical protein
MSDHWLIKVAQETPLHGWPYSAEDCLHDQFHGALRGAVKMPGLLLRNPGRLKTLTCLIQAHEHACEVLRARREAQAGERRAA